MSTNNHPTHTLLATLTGILQKRADALKNKDASLNLTVEQDVCKITDAWQRVATAALTEREFLSPSPLLTAYATGVTDSVMPTLEVKEEFNEAHINLRNLAIESVAQWHRAFGVPRHEAHEQAVLLRVSLQIKEYAETIDAILKRDPEETIDGFADELFVAAGTVDALAPNCGFHALKSCNSIDDIINGALALGIGLPALQAAFNEVTRANFAKLWSMDEVLHYIGMPGFGMHAGWTSTRAEGRDGFCVVRDDTGKIRKPPSWTGPDHSQLVSTILFNWPEGSPSA